MQRLACSPRGDVRKKGSSFGDVGEKTENASPAPSQSALVRMGVLM